MYAAVGALLWLFLIIVAVVFWSICGLKVRKLKQDLSRVEGEKQQAEQEKEATAAELAETREQLEKYLPIKDVEAEVQKMKGEAQQLMDDAKAKADAAESTAAEAGGKTRLYETTLQAIKNSIEGYGDEYIVPSQSVLDGLAEDFGFVDAGQNLKQARESTRKMVKEGPPSAITLKTTGARPPSLS